MAASITVIENTDTDITLSGQSTCAGITSRFEAVTQPQHGTLNIDGSVAHYSLGFFSGADSFEYRLCILESNECSSPARISVASTAREFSGRSRSLARYKDEISEREARYLVKKVAFGGCEQLIRLGVQQGLSRMVDSMLDDQYGGCTYSLPLDNSHGYNPTMLRPDNTDPDAYAYWMAHPQHWNLGFNYWTDYLFYRVLTVNARYNSPLNEYMSWMVWHPNFATYALGNTYDTKRHYNILEINALGYLGDYLRDFYGPQHSPDSPAQRRVPGVDPLLSFNPDKTAIDGTPIYPETGPFPVYGDKLYQTYLSNETNSVERPNENLGRELFEINLAGTNDIITGARNYLEDDVVASTLSITGLAFDFDGNENADGDPSVNLTSRGPDGAGPWRYFLSFFPQRTLLPAQQPITIFARTPYEHTAIFSILDNDPSSENYFDFLLGHWPAVSRHIGAKLFTHLVHQDLDEGVVSGIAANLLTMRETTDWRTGRTELKNFSIKEALRLILKSQAMFSERAYGHGVTSPFEMVFQMLRLADVRIPSQWVGDIVLAELGGAGHVPLAPPNVFGWQSFGVIGQGIIHDGTAWLNPTALLGVYRAVLTVLNHTFHPSNGRPSIASTFFPDHGIHCTTTDSSGCPSAAQLVDHMLVTFNLNGNDPISGDRIISDDERSILINFIDRPEDPWPQATLGQPNVVWSASVVSRTFELCFLIATHPATFRK